MQFLSLSRQHLESHKLLTTANQNYQNKEMETQTKKLYINRFCHNQLQSLNNNTKLLESNDKILQF